MRIYTLLLLMASVIGVYATEETDVLAQLTVLANGTVDLPCDISTRGLADKAHIVLWYRGASPAPFYSYDLRVTGGRRWSDETVFGVRAKYFPDFHPPSLHIKPVRPQDQDTYKCRVEFEQGPSKSSTVHLAVIVPPSPAVVTDETGSVVIGTAGPYLEGGRVVLTCKTIGGRPSPTLVWMRDGYVVEDSYTVDHRGQVRNLLHLDNLGRDLLDATFTCRATNNNVTRPLDTSITINMTLAPLTISLRKVVGPQEYVSAGVTEELECSATGSRPDPIISWWMDGLRITNPNVQMLRVENKTVSTLQFVPHPKDHGVVYTCRVQNPVLPTSVLEESYKLNVHYIPKVDLVMGMGIIPKSVREGTDVFFECRVKSNPKFHKITWIRDHCTTGICAGNLHLAQGPSFNITGVHSGSIIHHNVSAGVIVSNQSLVLQRVGRDRAGRYMCVATNRHGEGVSAPITITIMYTPVCSPGQKLQYQVGHHITANITCRVDAVPGNVTFHWKFNSSGSVLELGEGRAASWGTTSILPYTPASPGDYGVLLCTATNAIGTQHLPCVINVTAPKPPELLKGCVIRNQTTHSVFVTCQGVPTILPRNFTMEVRTSDDLNLTTKVTNTTPHFIASHLEPGTAYTLHVSVQSPMGVSPPIKLQAFTVKTAEKRMGINEQPDEDVLSMSPLIAIVAGASVAIVITLVLILGLAIKHCPRRRTSAQTQGYAPGSMLSDTSPKETISTFSKASPIEDRNPDLIPLKEDREYHLEELRVPNCPVVRSVPACHQHTSLAPSMVTQGSAVMVVPAVGGGVVTSRQQQDWDTYYQHHLHHHHRHHHHHHHHQPSLPSTSITSYPHHGCEVIGAPPPAPPPETLTPPPNFNTPQVTCAAYNTPVQHFMGGLEATQSASSSPILEPHPDYESESLRHESSV